VSKNKERLVKTYNSGDSPVVTHLTTSPPVRCLNRAERTGSLVFNVLWSYVSDAGLYYVHMFTSFPTSDSCESVLFAQLVSKAGL
jgi:hypothetical protein